MPKEKNQPVKKYWLKCTLGKIEYEYNVLAINSDWALSFISKETDWDSITVRKLSDVVALAEYGARCIDNETEIFYLHYHAKPI